MNVENVDEWIGKGQRKESEGEIKIRDRDKDKEWRLEVMTKWRSTRRGARRRDERRTDCCKTVL